MSVVSSDSFGVEVTAAAVSEEVDSRSASSSSSNGVLLEEELDEDEELKLTMLSVVMSTTNRLFDCRVAVSCVRLEDDRSSA